MKLASGPNTFNPPDLNYWKKWQIITAKNWYAQSMGFRAGVAECDFKCQNSSILIDANKVEVPIVAITAANPNNTCEILKLTVKDCDSFLIS